MAEIDKTRTQFGLWRTVCNCPLCLTTCKYNPGYLIPDDLERISQELSVDPIDWALDNLWASAGHQIRIGKRTQRVPMLVPQQPRGGCCKFLVDGKTCGIHKIAPYGCAFLDAHMSADERATRTTYGLHSILKAFADKAPYAYIWNELWFTEGAPAGPDEPTYPKRASDLMASTLRAAEEAEKIKQGESG